MGSPAATAPPHPAAGRRRATFRSYYLLILLGIAFGFAQLDRVAMSVLIEPIKAEFGLNDTEIALLTGLAFALFNAVTVVPIGVLADKVNRRNLIAISLSVWSLMTALGGLTVTFVQLLLTRISVGFGEGGCSSPSLSVIADRFAPEKRATAISIFYIFGPLGGLVALAGGGWIAGNYGWRATLIALGLPGMAIAALLVLTTAEPEKGAYDTKGGKDAGQKLHLRPALRTLVRCRSLRWIAIGITLISFFISAIGVWTLTFFVRSHAMKIQDAGALLALFQIVGLLGPVFGGVLADRLAGHDRRWWCWIVAICVLVAALFHLVVTLAASTTGALFAVGAYSLIVAIWYGPSYGMVQSLTPAQYRTTTTSIIIVLTNIFGFGLGTQFVGTLSDLLAPVLGIESLRYALMSVALAGIAASACFVVASFTIRSDLAS